jgi:hypothetical protein
MSGEDRLPVALLRQARGSGQLNLSNRRLKEVPESVWRINLDASAEAARSGEALSFDSEDRWWEQQELQRLILASNALTELSDGGECGRRRRTSEHQLFSSSSLCLSVSLPLFSFSSRDNVQTGRISLLIRIRLFIVGRWKKGRTSEHLRPLSLLSSLSLSLSAFA